MTFYLLALVLVLFFTAFFSFCESTTKICFLSGRVFATKTKPRPPRFRGGLISWSLFVCVLGVILAIVANMVLEADFFECVQCNKILTNKERTSHFKQFHQTSVRLKILSHPLLTFNGGSRTTNVQREHGVKPFSSSIPFSCLILK